MLTSDLMNKVRRKKQMKKGIQFCLMVCGASGTGMLARSPRSSLSPLPPHRYFIIQLTNVCHLPLLPNRTHYLREHTLRKEGSTEQGR